MRVRYLQSTDLFAGHAIAQAALIAQNFKPARKRYGINDIIELYNVIRFIENGSHLVKWDAAEKSCFYSVKSDLYRAVGEFFASVTPRNAKAKLSEVDAGYVGDFLTLFFKYKLQDKLSLRLFQKILSTNHIGVNILLQNESAAKVYPDFVRQLLLARPRNAELLISRYLARNDNSGRAIYLPAILTDVDKETLINQYLDSEPPVPNLNYIRLIVEAHNSDGLVVSDKMRLKAKRKLETESAKLFADSEGYPVEFQIGLSDNQDEDKIVSIDGGATHISFKKSWFENNLEYSDILNIFLYFFEYADKWMMLTLPSFEAELGFVDRFMGIRANTEYRKGVAFDSMDVISSIEMTLYYEFLSQHNIRFEEVIEWFFSAYLVHEFNINEFRVSMPGNGSNYWEKCNFVFPAMEGLLKQFSLYVAEGEIDQDLLGMSSAQTVFLEIPSLIEKKYVYRNSENSEINGIMNLLFSDQSGLGYMNDSLHADTFFELLNTKKVKLSDVQSYQLENIKFLKKERVLKVINGELLFRSTPQIEALYYLFHREAINYWRMTLVVRTEIDQMARKGLLTFSSTLLSTTESNYFNYNLNKREFGNGLDLRNRYGHGTPPVGEDAGALIHKQNYIIGLKLVVLLLIKINDDLCIKDEGGSNG